MMLSQIFKGRTASFLNHASKAYQLSRLSSTTSSTNYTFETLLVSQPSQNVFHVEINRPAKANSMSKEFWSEMKTCFDTLSGDSECRVILLSGKGKHFSSGIDISSLVEIGSMAMGEDDIARKCRKVKDLVTHFQSTFTSLEKCHKPVICAIHNACIGAALNLITAADIRYCSSDAYFQLKEVNLGLAADVGALQRLPKILGSESFIRELAYTGRKFTADEAFQRGLVSGLFPDPSSLMKKSLELASQIAEKSPVAVQASKDALHYARDHPVNDSLNYMATMNMAFLQSEDVKNAVMAQMQKEKATFPNL